MPRTRSSSKSTKETTELILPLGDKLNPRFSLDPDNLPPEYTPQVLLVDDFDQIAETAELTDKNNIETTETIVESSALTADVTQVNAPIGGISPGTLTCEKRGNAALRSNTVPSSSLHNNPSESKRSPFLRYLVRSASPKEKVPKKEPQEPENPAVPVKLSESPATPKLTGNNRLEKLLDEAIEEANERLNHSRFSVTSGTPPNVSPSPEPMDTSVTRSLLQRKVN